MNRLISPPHLLFVPHPPTPLPEGGGLKETLGRGGERRSKLMGAANMESHGWRQAIKSHGRGESRDKKELRGAKRGQIANGF